MIDFKFFCKNNNTDLGWWREDALAEAINAIQPNENVIQNNVLYERIQFLEDNLVRIRDENTQLNIEMDRLRRIINNS